MQAFSALISENGQSFCLNDIQIDRSEPILDPRFPLLRMEMIAKDDNFCGRVVIVSEEILGWLRAIPAWHEKPQGELYFDDEGKTEITMNVGKRGNIIMRGTLCGEHTTYAFCYEWGSSTLIPFVQQIARFLAAYDAAH